MYRCPECGSKNFLVTVYLELCEDCGYSFSYLNEHSWVEGEQIIQMPERSKNKDD